MDDDSQIRSILALNRHWYNTLFDYLPFKLEVDVSMTFSDDVIATGSDHIVGHNMIRVIWKYKSLYNIFDSRYTDFLMQENLSGVKHLKLKLDDSDSYRHDPDLTLRTILIRKESSMLIFNKNSW